MKKKIKVNKDWLKEKEIKAKIYDKIFALLVKNFKNLEDEPSYYINQILEIIRSKVII